MKIFAKNLTALMPAGITLAPELIEAFDWLEDQGRHHVRNSGLPHEHILSLYPDDPDGRLEVFGGTNRPYTSHWSTPDTNVDKRIAEIAGISSDGGTIAIWLDNAGKQQFVQLGHDNHGIITDDPVTLIRYLAIGYLEPGMLERTDITPVQFLLEYHGVENLADLEPEDRPVLPTAFQNYIKERFGVDIPATARDLGINDFPEYHDEATTDPFARWLTSVTPEPTEADLAYEMELMRTVESLNLQDSDNSETILQKIGSLFKSKDKDGK